MPPPRFKTNTSRVIVVMEAWQPPIQEILLVLQQMAKEIGPNGQIGLMLVGLPTDSDCVTAVTNEDWAIWHRTMTGLASPQITLKRLVNDHI